MNVLDRWGISVDELDEVIKANPSMYGLMLGYIAEHKLQRMLESNRRITGIVKPDDHDRTAGSNKADLVITYHDVDVRVQVKSLQTTLVKEMIPGEMYVGRFQCDASDRREIELPNGERVNTTCLKVGDFDLLAVNLFEFGQKWRFVFAHNADLPRSTYRKYSPEARGYLLASTMRVSWPPAEPYQATYDALLDRIVAEKMQSSK